MQLSHSPDVVVIGGGPIGLWTAIQTKFLTGKDVLVLEKYSEYKRADIRLNINASSFAGAADCEPLQALIRKWGNRLVPIKEMEDELTKCANEIGVKILNRTVVDPKIVQSQYPTARVFVGADGARSAVRKELFGNEYKFNTPLQYIAQVQYLIQTPKADEPPNGKIDTSVQQVKKAALTYKKQKFANHLITEAIRQEVNGLSRVTLHIFLDEQTYWKMADATFGNPYYFEADLHKVPDVLRDVLIKWWGSHKDHEIVNQEKKNKISIIPLASYAAKNVYQTSPKADDSKDQVVTALVGDASQAFPFFRAINNGFILGTKLSQCISKAFESLNEPAPTSQLQAKKFASFFDSYSYYSTFRAYVERIRAFVKNVFITLSSLWLKFSDMVPWQTVKYSAEERKAIYHQGAIIWKNLSGQEAPAYKQTG